MPSFVTGLRCSRCGRTSDHRAPHNLCDCGGPLLVDYELQALSHSVTKADMAGRPSTMWRYREFLPVEDERRVVSLGEGYTPLLGARDLGRRIGLPSLWVKDEGTNPTGTFKARGASAGITAAVERGLSEVALATAGNAGGAWAAYGDRAGVTVHVAMPSDAPQANQVECRAYGADLILVDGLISDAGKVIAKGARERGWFDVGSLREPYRVEGKKTLGLEIAEQLGWALPDTIVYPAGGGVGLIGIWQALRQLAEIGWVRGEVPRLVIVQAEGCAPLVKAFAEGREEGDPWPDPATIAHGLRVPDPLGDFLALGAVRETGGTAVAVSDDAIREAVSLMATDAGVSAGPEGAATLAGALELSARGDIRRSESVVLVNTGSGKAAEEASGPAE